MIKRLFIGIFLCSPVVAQTLYVPSGTGGVGSSANANVGIGTNSPSFKLDVVGTLRASSYANFNEYLTVQNGGSYRVALNAQADGYVTGRNVSGQDKFAITANGISYLNGGSLGIGTMSPGGLVEISGAYSGASQLILNSTLSNAEFRFSYQGTTKGFVWYNQVNDLMAFGRGSTTTSLFVNNSGNFGIGTTNPGSYKLAVEGKIGAREVNVTTNAWSDYVFNADYKLRPLAEVQQFIEENHHLPEVPSEKEVFANGQNLGEMNAILLKKIEELTLYVIELKLESETAKQRDEQQVKEVQYLRSIIEKLEKK